MKKTYVNPKIDIQLISTCDVIQSSGSFSYTPGSIYYDADGSIGNSITLW